jgi:hypothetical protein
MAQACTKPLFLARAKNTDLHQPANQPWILMMPAFASTAVSADRSALTERFGSGSLPDVVRGRAGQ